MNRKHVACTGFTLKIIALMFMILDHVHTYLYIGPEWVSLLTRFVAPLFLFLLVEGFYHTRNRRKYFLRVCCFAMFVLSGNILINYIFHSVNYMTGKMDLYSLTQGHNIFLTFAAYLLILELLCLMKNHDRRRVAYIAGIVIISVLSLPFCEGSFYLLPLLFIFYFCHDKKRGVYAGVIIWSFLLLAKALISYFLGATGISLYSTLCFDNEWAMAAVIIPISLYSGERGLHNKFAKWLFYLVYPAHLWILMILRNLIDQGMIQF